MWSSEKRVSQLGGDRQGGEPLQGPRLEGIRLGREGMGRVLSAPDGNFTWQKGFHSVGVPGNEVSAEVNVQPYSGSPANFAVYTALLPPHARTLGVLPVWQEFAAVR